MLFGNFYKRWGFKGVLLPDLEPNASMIGPKPLKMNLLKVNTRNTWKKCEMCSKLPIKIPERRQWRRYGIFLVVTLNLFHIFFKCFYCWLWTGKCLLGRIWCMEFSQIHLYYQRMRLQNFYIVIFGKNAQWA